MRTFAAEVKEDRPHFITFQNLAETTPLEYIALRGFLYLAEDGRWILSPEPHLKTCCVGSQNKIAQQIVLDGSFDQRDINKVLSVHGYLEIRNGVYYLLDAHADVDVTHSGVWTFGIIAILMAAAIFILTKSLQGNKWNGRT